MARSRVVRKNTIHLVRDPVDTSQLGRSECKKNPSEVVVDGLRYRLVPVGSTIAVASKSPVPSLLTARELQIVALVGEGRVNKQIAADLHISEWTVSTHLKRIFVKLGVDTRAAMVLKWSQGLSRQDPLKV